MRPPSCINCQGAHLATSTDCPITTRQSAIASLAAINNIPLFEARKIVNQNHYNSHTLSANPASFGNPNAHTHAQSLNGDPRTDFHNFPLPRNNLSTNSNSFNSNDRRSFQSHNRFDLLSGLEDHPPSPAWLPNPGSNSYANVVAGRGHSTPISQSDRSAHFTSPPSSTAQGSPLSSKEGHPNKGSRGNNSSSPPPSASGPRNDPGMLHHCYPNGRFPSPSGNGVAYDRHEPSDSTSSNHGFAINKNFIADFSTFFFKELLPLFFRGEYSTVFDASQIYP